MSETIIKSMALSLALTLLIECVAAWLLGIRTKKDMLKVVLVNVLTNPVVVSLVLLAGYRFGSHATIGATIYLELFAFLTEALIYRKTLSFRKINPFLLSLILNATSYFTGVILNNFI